MNNSLEKLKKNSIHLDPYSKRNKNVKNQLGLAWRQKKLEEIIKNRTSVDEIIGRCDKEAERSFKDEKSHLMAEEIKQNFLSQGMEK